MSIVLEQVSKRYGDQIVVNNVSLEVQQGELFVLLGPSGSGKSTILRQIAGLVDVDSGRIELNGRDVTHVPTQKRGVGFVFQNYSLFPYMTVTENIEFGLGIRKVPRADRRQRSEELLDIVGLSGLGRRHPSQLSGGQQQRVALARALAYQPEVLLLDEPFGALDVKIRAQLRESLKAIQRELTVTTILVTHDQEEAFELADRIGVIDRGSLVEVGNPEDLYHRPKTEFASIFLGGGNVLVGRRDEKEITMGAASLPFPADAPPHDPGAPVRVLFRPETVILQRNSFKNNGIYNLGQGRVIGQTFTGSAKRIRLEVEGLQGVRALVPALHYGQHATHIEALVTSAVGDDSQFTDGELVCVGVKDFHVLDPTGLKLLICYTPTDAGEAATAFGLRLAQAAHGPAELLAVAPATEAAAKLREQVEAVRAKCEEDYGSRLTTKVRSGSSPAEILLEAQEGFYEMIILGRNNNPGAKPMGIGATAQRVLAHAAVPVLLVSEPRDTIRRILICTAGGEPGKSDVRFGGRLARRTGAEATVLHVSGHQTSARERNRVEKHLNQAQASLRTLGVKSNIRIEEGPALNGILQEAEAGDYDLVVIGAPTPGRHIGQDFATQFISATSRPVVVVPMQK